MAESEWYDDEPERTWTTADGPNGWKQQYAHPLRDVVSWPVRWPRDDIYGTALRLSCRHVPLPDFCTYREVDDGEMEFIGDDDVETSRMVFREARDLEICDSEGTTPVRACFLARWDRETSTGHAAFRVLHDIWTRFPVTFVQQLGYVDPINLDSPLGWAHNYECVELFQWACECGMMTDVLLNQPRTYLKSSLKKAFESTRYPHARHQRIRQLIDEWSALPEGERRARSRRFYAPVLDPLLVHAPRHELNIVRTLVIAGRAVPHGHTPAGSVFLRLFDIQDAEAVIFRKVATYAF